MPQSAATNERIKSFVKEQGSTNSPELAVALSVSRQRANVMLSNLVRAGELVKIGRTKGSRYFLSTEELPIQGMFARRVQNDRLKEHQVLQEIRDSFLPLKLASDTLKSIFDYAFSEMLNNAIEHSDSKDIDISVSVRGGDPGKPAMLAFTVRDYGVGAFRNVMKSRKLASELEAMQDLLKGKVTTAPKAHSGEGIFFTSKTADVFIIRSFEWEMRVDTTIPDVFFSKLKEPVEGTEVHFSIAYNSKRHLTDVFRAYESGPAMQDFDRTEILVRLFTHGTVHVSRSQARRILSGLEKFKRITLDFKRVPTIGQAFADEIFRVFLTAHPDISIETANANEAVEFMIQRVDRPVPGQEHLDI